MAACAKGPRARTAWQGHGQSLRGDEPPSVRATHELAVLSDRLPRAGGKAVGGWWKRQFGPEFNLVGADRAPVAREARCVGSVKWLGTPSDAHGLSAFSRRAVQASIPTIRPGILGL